MLLFLQELQSQAPEFYYRYAADKLGLGDLRNLMLFSRALAELK